MARDPRPSDRNDTAGTVVSTSLFSHRTALRVLYLGIGVTVLAAGLIAVQWTSWSRSSAVDGPPAADASEGEAAPHAQRRPEAEEISGVALGGAHADAE